MLLLCYNELVVLLDVELPELLLGLDELSLEHLFFVFQGNILPGELCYVDALAFILTCLQLGQLLVMLP